jgi:uncharacterized membrane protein
MFSRVMRWINDRWPFRAMMRLGLEEDMAGGDSFAYIFGSSVLTFFLIQVITGLWQLFYFVPTIHHGYDSLRYLRIYNNSPTLQDVWNSTPAFGFSYAASSVAPTPAADTVIDGALDQQGGGMEAYALWNNMIYAGAL